MSQRQGWNDNEKKVRAPPKRVDVYGKGLRVKLTLTTSLLVS